MFTIFDPATREVRMTVSARTREIAYRKAERVCDRLSGGLVFDDTCEHGTAYDLCSAH